MPNLIEIKREKDVLYVYWTITDFCNFRCNYCPTSLHSGDFKNGRKPGYPTDDEIRTFLDRLINIHSKGRFLHVCISGGEPTLHPMYEEIVNTLHPYGLVETITNGTRSIEWWKQLKHLPDKITMSLHVGWTKIDKINEIGEFLLDNNVFVAYNMMCDPGKWESVQAMYQQLTPRLQALVNAKILTDHSGGATDGQPWEYHPEQIEYIKNTSMTGKQQVSRFSNVDLSSTMIFDDGSTKKLRNPFDLVNNSQHSFKGWECSAGNTGITISFDGFAYGANCRSFKLGRLDTFNLLDQPVKCPRQWCKTAADIPLSKKKITSLLDQ
jgi:organic radical activating enzyme